GARGLAITGLSILTISSVPFIFLKPETSLTWMTIVYAVRLFGISMVMMPATTAGLNQLPQRLIPHGTAMNNTMRQVSGSMGTAILVTVMTSSALRAGSDPSIAHAKIHGVNVAFSVSVFLT